MKKLVILLIAGILTSAMTMAQSDKYTFSSPKVMISKKGERKETTTEKPTVIVVDHAANVLEVETGNAEIKSLLKNKLTWKIEETMGEVSVEYSVRIDEFTFVHFLLEPGMIIFTRNDIHPLQWGLHFSEVTQVE